MPIVASLIRVAIKALIVTRIVASLIRVAEDDLCGWVSLEGYVKASRCTWEGCDRNETIVRGRG